MENKRMRYQTGGVTQVLPPDYIETAQRAFLTDLSRQAGTPSITTATQQLPGETDQQFAERQAQAQQFQITKAGMADLAPQVAAQDALQTAAITQATDPTKGLGGFQPFLEKATTAADTATGLTGPITEAQRTAFMSPYQTAVIDTTLAEFDRQAQQRQNELAARTLGTPGAFGGGREGVQRAEFDAASDRNRAALQAGLLQQGFQQAQRARQQDLQNQIGIANLQSGLGARAQDLARTQIAGLGTLGATQQAQTQAELDAQRVANQLAAQERFDRLSQLGSGVIGLMGGSPARTSIAQTPQASPLASALGIGSTLAGIYGALT